MLSSLSKKHDLVLLAGVRVTSNTDKCMGSDGKDVFFEPRDVITKKVKLQVEGMTVVVKEGNGD